MVGGRGVSITVGVRGTLRKGKLDVSVRWAKLRVSLRSNKDRALDRVVRLLRRSENSITPDDTHQSIPPRY